MRNETARLLRRYTHALGTLLNPDARPTKHGQRTAKRAWNSMPRRQKAAERRLMETQLARIERLRG